MGKILRGTMVVLALTFTTGCTVFEIQEEKLQDIEYTIVKEENQPEEVQLLVEDNQDKEMKMSYTDQGVAYIIIGYGAQETSGYSVEVLEVYETENTVQIDTNLMGPLSSENVVEVETYPYIVICIAENEKPIVYE